MQSTQTKAVKLSEAKIKLEARFYTVEELEEIVNRLKDVTQSKRATRRKQVKEEPYDFYGV